MCIHIYIYIVLFSRPVISDSLQPHGLQHARLLCPSPFPGICPSSLSLHQVMPFGHLIIWCSFLLLPSIFPSSRTSPVSRLFTSDDQNTGSVSISVLPVNIEGWSPLRLTSLISLLLKGLSGVFSSTTVKGINSLAFCLLYGPAIHDHWEDLSLDYKDLSWQCNVSGIQHTV